MKKHSGIKSDCVSGVKVARKALTPANVLRLSDVFKKREWKEYEETNFGSSLNFDSYCRYISSFSSPQQDLLVELTERFVLTDDRIRRQLMMKAMRGLTECADFSSRKKILSPLVQPGCEGGSSANAAFYLIKSMNDINKFRVTFADVLRGGIYFYKNTHLICLVDDYIGTGETAEACIRYVSKLLNINDTARNMAVVVLAGQEQGIKNIYSNTGVKVYSGMTLKRGISDMSKDPADELSIMNEIEDNIGAKDDYRLGYGQSEALIKLFRTPNNVFPVFWLCEKDSKIHEDAPFVRRG